MLLSFFVQAQELREWCPDPNNPDTCCLVDGVPTLKCTEVLFGNILAMASILILLVLFIMFLIGGFNYLTSFGSAEKVKKAQGTLKYAFIGLGLYVVSFLILRIIDVLFLGGMGTIFQFNIPNL
jgi:hypothetical protein